MHPALRITDHRPWPLPSGPWIMVQKWHDLLFAHWPVAPEIIRPLIPEQLALDLFDGRCWVGVVPFWMSGVRARSMPPIPGTSRFPELNVRTYVTYGTKPGVHFFSLDAANRLAVQAARALYRLPYFYARMHSELVGEDVVYTSSRRGERVEFRARYRPTAPVEFRRAGTLDHWLTERYCLYTIHKEKVYRCEIHHAPWPLQAATAEISLNTMASAAQVPLPDGKPLLHFSKLLDVLIWPLREAQT